MTFDRFFEQATSGLNSSGLPPYDYQRRLACGDNQADEKPEDWLSRGAACESKLIEIPTGLGKTAAVVLAWLWNRVALPDDATHPAWPRRLVYCLPMRTLVEQTAEEVKRWIDALLTDEEGGRALGDGAKAKLKWLAANSPVILMGGEDAGEWDLHPEREAVLIGTQDMLLSRALNRGYGMKRYRWPMHFGLLNNDVLWVLDETQLMGPGLSTACQLEAFRMSNAALSYPQGYGSMPDGRAVTWYMSATANVDRLKTTEWREATRSPGFTFDLSPAEKAATSGPVHKRRFAAKELELQPMLNFSDTKPSSPILAQILSRHDRMLSAVVSNPSLAARTLIICNTVDRAMSVHAAIAEALPSGCDLLLLHSRFRPPEREEQMKRLRFPDLAAFPKGQIVVATQVIEAGVDLSSAVLWSEVAPLASLVQRLGRLNRHGEFTQGGWKPAAIVVGIGVEAAPPRETNEARENREKKNVGRCLPYELRVCEAAWKSLEKLKGHASPVSLQQIQSDIAASIPRCPYSLQRHELLDFFDTDANLSLGFTDVSPFVRGLDEDTDLQVLWRDQWMEKDGKPDFLPDFHRDELCSVPFARARNARSILDRGWLWRGKESGWISVRDSGLAPGMTILLPLSAGGYNTETGWTGEGKDNKHISHYQASEEPSDEELLSCLANGWQSIAIHTAEVSAELTVIWNATIPDGSHVTEHEAFNAAVPWHDVGKNHPDWQQAVMDALKAAGITGREEHLPFAKFSLSDSPTLRYEDGSPRFFGKDLKREANSLRRLFRPVIAHEVASALAFRQSEQARFGTDRPLSSLLAEYLIMMHHGRVRKVLRDEIPRFPKDAKDSHTVRGVVHGSDVPMVIIDGKSLGCVSLSSDCRRMGRDPAGNESYTRGVLRILEHYGPFRIGFFEAVFRAADIRASKAASKRHTA